MAHDNIFSLIDVRDTARGVLRLCSDESIKICHFASSPPVRRTDLAARIKATSRYGKMMDYGEVNFADIHYTEPRGRYNQLDTTLATSHLELIFRPTDEIIREKVELLDTASDLKTSAAIAETKDER